ncbi:acyl--CoA ligase [Streptomyces sp. CHA1]|uniref:class I adenylate-forming enzyme family protein n=1 Tax=Streptomyces TaxID=1883 RepID=UPI0003C324DE|nr:MULTISPECIES: class I adenylate-forming enzyme family protein [unclassified Streptomyces]QPA01349.1 long-chain fatty acid--CoA ligase [Streptomyces violascens]ESP97464.1 acyl-CoA-ligase/synthetase [Streptomyces sp. GBA 94-10 4N24]ESQ03084.1 acyl-CoA-ligase/synthetase [Streptomyces sp. PVA_94-07]MBP3079844.1 acyl--CoA ligase [Streptomyces sp. 604F]MBT3161151.1 acyl--CoA ligase [Streptomyces sp. G11C]
MVDPNTTDRDLAHRYEGVPFSPRAARVRSILGHLDRQARERGGEPYLTTPAADGTARMLTYGELDRYSRRTAHWLDTSLGLPAGGPVGLTPVNDVPSVVALFAALRSGRPVLVLNPADPAVRVAEQTTALGVEAIVTGPATADGRFRGSVRAPDPERLPDPPHGWAPPPPQPGADMLYFGTSGSTAASKLVAQTHANAVANADAVIRHHGLRPGDTLLGCLPIHHVNGVHLTLFATLAAGAHAVLAQGFDPFRYPELLTLHRPRVASVVPSILDALTAVWRRRTLPADFSHFVSAAAPLSAETARAVHTRIGARVLQGYGLTETTNFSTTMPRDVGDAAYRRLLLDADIPTVGVAVPGNEVAVLGPDGSRARPGEPGEICMRGHNVMSRYAGNEEATDEAFAGGWFHSGDLGQEVVDEETGRTYFVITGRSKNIAKVRGEAVSLEEMERALRRLPGVLDAACAAVPDPLLGEVVAVALHAPDSVNDDAVRTHLRAHFAEAVQPARILRVPEVPRTATGKIIRPALGNLLARPT